MQPTVASAMQTLALNTAKKFRADYLVISREAFWDADQRNHLLHAGEFGVYREQLLRTLLASYLPARLSIGSGFLGTPLQHHSTQCDVVIYDRDTTPSLDLSGGRVFYPTETCAAVGEVKSTLSFAALKEALQKLACTKRLRAEHCPPGLPVAPNDALFAMWSQLGLGDVPAAQLDAHRQGLFQPSRIEQQNLVTFLVCEKIEWPSEAGPGTGRFHTALAELYPRSSASYHLRHNLLLSLEDGFLSYFSGAYDEAGERRSLSYPFPRRRDTDCGWRWLPASDDALHVLNFAAECALAASRTWIYEFLANAHLQDARVPHYDYFPLS